MRLSHPATRLSRNTCFQVAALVTQRDITLRLTCEENIGTIKRKAIDCDALGRHA